MAGNYEKGKSGFNTIYTSEKIQEIVKAYDLYIETAPIPIVAEFAYLNKIPKATLYEIPEFRKMTERCVTKKEFLLEKGALTGDLEKTMAIFSLKQLGWTDKKEVELSEKRPLVVENELLDVDPKTT